MRDESSEGAVQRAFKRNLGKSVRILRCSIQAEATCDSHLRRSENRISGESGVVKNGSLLETIIQ